MLAYNILIPAFTLAATTTQFGTLVAAALRGLFVTEIDFQGNGAGTSSNNEFGLFRINVAGVTPTGALLFRPTNPAYPAAAATAFTTYATQPTILGTDPVQNCPINGNGQRYNFKALPNFSDAIWVPPGNTAAASVGLFTIQGTASVKGRLKVFEV